MQRPLFRAVLKRIKEDIERQQEDGQPFIAVSRGFFTLMQFRVGDRTYTLTDRMLEKAWPALTKAAGLVDDGTKTGTYTLPGRGILNHYKDLA